MSEPQPAFHPDMAVIALTGDDPVAFLHDLLTADIAGLDQTTARAACLLSPQGRILFDMMVIRDQRQIFLATEAGQAEALIKRLTLYRLRRKINFTACPELVCMHSAPSALPGQLPENSLIRRDERHDGLGHFCLVPAASADKAGSDADWQANRIRLGIPQGADDLIPNRALMLEAGLHLLGAVDFKKGCYIGQEVTARTHYRGLVKRRLFPVRTQAGRLYTDTPLMLGQKEVGRCGSVAQEGAHSFSLASIRLDAAKAVSTKGERLSLSDGSQVDINIPDWMHPLPGFDDSADEDAS